MFFTFTQKVSLGIYFLTPKTTKLKLNCREGKRTKRKETHQKNNTRLDLYR